MLAELTAAGPVLVHFFDFAQLNSVRALPYVIAWDRALPRRRASTTLGVHSPRFSFTSEPSCSGRRSSASASPIRSSTTPTTPSGTTTAARAGRRCSSGPRAARCAGFTSARASTTRPSRRSRPSSRGSTRRFEPPRAARAAARDRRPRCARRAAERRDLPGRLGHRAVASADRDGRTRARVRGRRCPRHGRPAPGELRVSIDGGRGSRDRRSGAPAWSSSPRILRHQRHSLSTAPRPGSIYSVSFSAGVP